MKLAFRSCCCESEGRSASSSHLSDRGPTELAPSSATSEDLAKWLPGFHRAVPSTPLDASGYVLVPNNSETARTLSARAVPLTHASGWQALGYAAGVASASIDHGQVNAGSAVRAPPMIGSPISELVFETLLETAPQTAVIWVLSLLTSVIKPPTCGVSTVFTVVVTLLRLVLVVASELVRFVMSCA